MQWSCHGDCLHKSGRIIIGARQRSYCKFLKHFIQGLVITADNRIPIAASSSCSYSWVCRAQNRKKFHIAIWRLQKKKQSPSLKMQLPINQFNNTKSDNLTMGKREKKLVTKLCTQATEYLTWTTTLLHKQYYKPCTFIASLLSCCRKGIFNLTQKSH